MPFYPGDEEYERMSKILDEKKKAKQKAKKAKAGKKLLRKQKRKAKVAKVKAKLNKKQKAMKAIYGRTK